MVGDAPVPPACRAIGGHRKQAEAICCSQRVMMLRHESILFKSVFEGRCCRNFPVTTSMAKSLKTAANYRRVASVNNTLNKKVALLGKGVAPARKLGGESVMKAPA
jgi:hypothetical protein